MRRWVVLLFVVTLLLLLTGAAGHQAVQAQTEDAGWQATYWNNMALAGNPVFQRSENVIAQNWGLNPPLNGMSPDHFSARWTRTLQLPAGQYRFTVTADDGVRLWVNGRLIIDQWQAQSATHSSELYLPAGPIPMRLEYFEATGTAFVELSWTPVSVFVNQWLGVYFNNTSLSGSPAMARDDSTIDFNWGAGSPAPDVIAPDGFSVRWTRAVSLPAGQYRFTVTADDGVRLWVNNRLLVDRWQSQPATTYEREAALPGGSVPIHVEYYENGGQALIQLSWTRIHELPPEEVPNLPPAAEGATVDNESDGFVQGGPAEGWYSEPAGWGGSMVWTQNNTDVPGQYNWARWYPDLHPGVYEVNVYIPEAFSTTSQARYWVSHANGYTMRVVDQAAYGDQWVSLGTFEFDGTRGDYLSLADVTFETDNSRLVAFDAARWLPQGPAGQGGATVTPAVASPGTLVTVYGRDFPPGERVYLRMGLPDMEPLGQYGQAVAAEDGTATIQFIMPANWPDGRAIEDTLPVSNELVLRLTTEAGVQATTSVTFAP